MTAMRNHTLVVVATLAGIGGMGLLFDGLMRGSVGDLTAGLPLLMVGLWWSGRELARSKQAASRRRILNQRRNQALNNEDALSRTQGEEIEGVPYVSP